MKWNGTAEFPKTNKRVRTQYFVDYVKILLFQRDYTLHRN